MSDKKVRLKDASGNFLCPETKATVVYNNSNQNLSTVEAGAQVNVLEKVKVNGVELTVSNKTVDVIVPTHSYSAGTGIEITNNAISVDNTIALKSDVPTKTSDLNNDSGYITGITSSDVTTALGYTPYNSTNPNGYTSNVGTVTSVNNVAPVSGNVTLNIPSATSDLTNDSGFITSSALSGYQTTSNLVTSVSSSSTDSQYPSAKLFYDTCGDIETLINAL